MLRDLDQQAAIRLVHGWEFMCRVQLFAVWIERRDVAPAACEGCLFYVVPMIVGSHT